MDFIKKHGIQMVLVIGIFVLLIRIITLFMPCSEQEFQPIVVVSREQGSGSRTIFQEMLERDYHNEGMTFDAIIHPGNGIIANFVAKNPNAIGYVSLSTYLRHRDVLRGLSIDGIAPTPANMLSGVYPLIRPFNLVYPTKYIGDIERVFVYFATTTEGLTALEKTGVVVDFKHANPFNYNGFGELSGSVTFGGSTSTESSVLALIDAFTAFFPDVNIAYMAVGSGGGIQGALDGTFSLAFVSREVTDLERLAGLEVVQYSVDGLVIIVNPKNPRKHLTLAQLRAIYHGEIRYWDEIGWILQ